MADFPIQRAQGTLPGRAAGVRAGLDVSTGAELVAGAAAGLGRGITGLGIKFDIMEADTQFTKAKRLAREEINRLALSFNTNDDPATYQAELDKSLETIESFAPKNSRAASEFDRWSQDRVPQWQSGVEQSMMARLKDNFRAEGFNLKTEAERTGNVGPYLAHLEKGRTANFDAYTDEEVARLGIEVIGKADYNTALNEIHIDPDNVDNILKEHPNLTAPQRVVLKREARVVSSNRRAQTERERNEVYERTEKEGWKMWRDGRLTEEWLELNIDSLNLSARYNFTAILDREAALETKQQAALEKINAAKDKDEAGRLIVKGINAGTVSESIINSAAEAYDFSPAEYEGYLRDLRAKQQAVIPYEQLADLSDIIDGVREGRPEEDLAKAEIADVVMKAIANGVDKETAIGIGEQYRARLSSAIAARKDTDNPLNRPEVKEGFKTLEEIKDAEIAGKKATGKDEKGEKYDLAAEVRDRLEWVEKKNDFQNFIMTTPDVSFADIGKKLTALTEGAKKEATSSFLGKIWWQYGALRVIPRLKPKTKEFEKEIIERESVRLESAPAIELDAIWPSLSDKQKMNVWRAFDNGYTSQEILTVLEKR